VLQNQHTNTLVKKKGIQLTHWCLQNCFEMSKNSEKDAKNTFVVEPPSTKMLLSHSYLCGLI
jgi:hypothetical protein